MTDPHDFALAMLLVGLVGLAGVLSNRITERVRIPAPAIMLAAAAIAVTVVPALHSPRQDTVEHLVTAALLCILFDGGMHIGWRRFREAAVPILLVGTVGTFATAAGAALFLHAIVGLAWYPSLLVATAVSPTDPAVVFSVIGQREVEGASGTVLEGESGANDPVGIALMASLLSAGELSGSAFGHVLGEFVLQMAVGAAIGIVGGIALIWFMRHVPLPSEGLYPLRTLAAALALYGGATLAHGSGFLAVFVAGIVVGDARAPYKLEIERFHSALGSLGEIVAFVALGLTVDLGQLVRTDVWLPGLALGAVLAIVIRPLSVGPCLTGSGLGRRERTFVLFAGLKGAVPILLGSSLLATSVAHAERLYGVVVVVVVFSVVVQGSLVPVAAAWLRIPMREVEPEPWSLGVRLRDEPDGAVRMVVAPGSIADGRAIRDLHDLPEGSWISLIVRDGRILGITDHTHLRSGDEVLLLVDPSASDEVEQIFRSR